MLHKSKILMLPYTYLGDTYVILPCRSASADSTGFDQPVEINYPSRRPLPSAAFLFPE